MPRGADWIQFIYVNLGFFAQVLALYYFSSVAEIKKNWPLYRCNPLYMPLSDNIEQDFTYCVQNTQQSFMGFILQPLEYITSNLSQMGGELFNNVNSARGMISTIRSFFTNILQSIFGVFMNIIIEFQKVIIGINDLAGKIIGIMVTLMYMLDGGVKTMQSSWNGPIGQTVQSLSGNCFDPSTLVELKNGSLVKMADLSLGDILITGERVNAVMIIDNYKNEKMYKFPKKGINGADIMVTGTHQIALEDRTTFVQVKEHPLAEITDILLDHFVCIITDNHHIQIGSHLFWDWEDWILRENATAARATANK